MANNEDVFVRHLILLLSIYELGSKSALVQDVACGKILDLKNTINGMVIWCVIHLLPPLITFPPSLCVQILRALTAKVTRITLQVGSQGMFRGQADVPNIEGVWFELVQNTCPDSL